MSLLVIPEDVWIEEGFAAEWAHQPHSQMHFPNMGKQLPMRLMGPPCSPQPGIDKLIWCPPVEF